MLLEAFYCCHKSMVCMHIRALNQSGRSHRGRGYEGTFMRPGEEINCGEQCTCEAQKAPAQEGKK